MANDSKLILLTGPTGYVGGRLLRALEGAGVKGGEKPDRRGGAKLGHFRCREGLICFDQQG